MGLARPLRVWMRVYTYLVQYKWSIVDTANAVGAAISGRLACQLRRRAGGK